MQGAARQQRCALGVCQVDRGEAFAGAEFADQLVHAGRVGGRGGRGPSTMPCRNPWPASQATSAVGQLLTLRQYHGVGVASAPWSRD